MENQSRKVAIFDVCDTLYYSNTTYDFIYFFLNQKSDVDRLKKFKRFVDKKLPWVWVHTFLSKLLKKDISKQKVVALLYGYTEKELYHSAVDFVHWLQTGRKILETHSLLSNLKKQGYDVILSSASLDPIVAAIAEQLEVKFTCTTLEYDGDGICLGKCSHDIAGKKLEALSGLLRNTNKVVVISDNRSDKALFHISIEKYMIVYNHKDKEFWSEMNGEFIELKKRPYTYE